MHVVPQQDDVVRILRESGALREGHFVYPNGLHSNEYLQVPLAIRHYQHARTLSVGLSRLLRADPELHALAPQLAIVSPAPAGIPIAFGICQALDARQVYWGDVVEGATPGEDVQLRLRQFIEPQKGDSVVLVDDVLRTGRHLAKLKALIESYGANVLAIAVVVYQPTPKTHDFGDLPIRYLARLDASYYTDGAACELCRKGVPAERAWVA